MKFAETSGYKLFNSAYGTRPEWVTQAPGRVNLIGEHTDYNLLPVLPMSIDRSIRIYGRARTDSKVRLTNTSSDFTMAEIDLDAEIEPVPGHWTNYVRAALRFVAADIIAAGQRPFGFDAVIESDLPGAAGLSSSSALVIASCLAILHTNDIPWTMEEIADKMRLAERFVGTAGGGMDQAAISLGREGSALLIEFDPLVATPVSVPDSISIFIINSGQKAEKTGSARFNFNRRALECAVAVRLLQRGYASKMDTSAWESLRDVYQACNKADVPLTQPLLECLPLDPPSVQTVIELVGRDAMVELCAERQLDIASISEWLPGNSFQVYARAAHVLNEAQRVYEFQHALQADQPKSLFHLARASHASCRDLYHISTPAIEQLISVASECGAGAARITGAGFGGCVVAFVPADRASGYASRLESSGVPGEHIVPARSIGPAQIVAL